MSLQKQSESYITLSDGRVLDPFVKQLLEQRGITGEESIVNYLEPKLMALPNPFLMKDMDLAVDIVVRAIRTNIPILIWGDYDVDGTTATALLLKFFNSIGYQADFYIPNRLTEGYGLSIDPLERITPKNKDEKKLLITVDNGISAYEAVNHAKKLGYDVIITDHHMPPNESVSADAIINPKQKGCDFPDKNLAGVGLAFYLTMGIRNRLGKSTCLKDKNNLPNLKMLLDLVGIGTVADMVALTGVNRTLVKAGMETMALKTNKGLEALCRRTNIDSTFVRSEDIAFQIAPKINAAGRLGVAEKAVYLLLSNDKNEAEEISQELICINKRRINISLNQFDKAMDDVSAKVIETKYSIIVAGDYHIGVAGIVASNLVQKYNKPSVILCNHADKIVKGSARSVPGVDLYKALHACQSVLLGYGGHKMAGGMSLDKEKILKFAMLFDESVFFQNNGIFEEDSEKIDANITVSELFSKKLLAQIHLMEPFGQENPQLIFRDTQSVVVDLRHVGKDKKHLGLNFVCGNSTVKGIGFGLGDLKEKCETTNNKDFCYTPSVNFFRGKRSWQVRVTNIAFHNQ